MPGRCPLHTFSPETLQTGKHTSQKVILFIEFFLCAMTFPFSSSPSVVLIFLMQYETILKCLFYVLIHFLQTPQTYVDSLVHKITVFLKKSKKKKKNPSVETTDINNNLLHGIVS